MNEKYNFGVILKEDTPECLAEAVKMLYNDKDLYNTLKNNTEKLIADLNWESEFDKLLKREEKLFNK